MVLDTTGKANGRGVYLCLNEDCITKARKKKAVSRGLERDVNPEQLEKVFEELLNYEREDS